MIQDILKIPILILGCGNRLFGVDGFGPAVIEHLEAHYPIPETAWGRHLGTGIRDFLFDLLISPIKPRRIYIGYIEKNVLIL